ncbi:SusC/RagA family protein [Macellibacteroides sp. HH-ZS]|nr:SusC/RagA family protein [Macellibacteroides sp. HH-ZS]
MKLSVFFLLCSIGLAQAADSYAQKATVNLEMRNQTVKEVLDEIEEQSDFSFFFNIKHVDLNRKVTVVAKKSDLFKVLGTVFAGTDVHYSVVDRKIILSTERQEVSVLQQKVKLITGVVKDQSGEPIIGANVTEHGTTNGTITDIDGNFSLEVKPGATMLISYIGYESQEIKIGNQTVYNIKLSENSQALDEVVVVGFGTQKKVNLTGSVGTVSSEAIEARPVMTATQALQGMVPGLQISQNNGMLENRASINIRGVATIGKGSTGAPLILIDGMEGDINAINPQDIDNISVLKDAAASSIYGARAPFGVILVTTKKGRTGKPTLNYNNSFRWSDPVLMPEMVDSYTFARYFNEANTNGGSSPQFSEAHLKRILEYQTGERTTSVIPNPNNPSYWADGYLYGNDNIDWYDTLYREWVFSQEHNMSLSGGTDVINYYISFNYLDQNGLMEFNQDTYDRYAATAKINVKINSWSSLNYSNRFLREDYGRPSFLRDDLFSNIGRQGWPTLPLYDPNGYLYDSPSPALNLRDGGRGIWQTDYLYQQGQLVLEPIKNWKTFAEFNYRIKSSNTHWDIQKTYNHDVAGNPYPSNNNSHVHEDQVKDNYLNINLYSEYTKNLESGHNLKGMVGFQAELYKTNAFSAQREGIIVPSLPEIDITTGIDANGKIVSPEVGGSRNHWSTAGFFGRINYDYKEKYLTEVNFRYDGTSRFRKDNRWNLFPSVSVGWNISRESFWENWVDYIGTLKLRASYGELGNQNTSSLYPTYQTMGLSAASGSWIMNGAKPNTATVPGLVSSTLTWERVNTWNIGADWGLFSNRLTGSFDYFNRKTLDMVGPAPELPVTLGTSVPSTNNTDLNTYGFELSISWNDKLQNGLGYGVKLMLSDSQTEITRYPNETGRLDTYRKGMKMGEIWGYTTSGIAKKQQEMDDHLTSLPNGGQNAIGNKWAAGDIMYKDINNDGKISNGANTWNDHGDLTIIGNNSPRYQFGLDLTADYKGFDIRAFFQGVMKRDYFQGSYYFWGASGSGIWHSTCMPEHLDYFRDNQEHYLGENINSYFPRPLFNTSKNQQTQTRYLQNASYIRLKNLQLGYTLPNTLTRKIALSNVRFYISGENLWTGSSMFGTFDPETVGGGWGGNVYPLSKTVSCGLNINF